MSGKERKITAVNIAAILLSFAILSALITASLMENTFARVLQEKGTSISSTVDPVDISVETTANRNVEASEMIAKNDDETESDADKTIVTVNGVEITQNQLDKRCEPLLAQLIRTGKTPDEQAKTKLRQNVLDEMMKEQLISMAISSSEIDITDEQINTKLTEIAAGQNKTAQEFLRQATEQGIAVNQVQQQLKRAASFDKLLGAETDIDLVTVSEEEAKKYYEENTEKFTVPRQIRASHILFGTGKRDDDGNPLQADQEADAQFKRSAERIAKEIRAGADFEDLVRKHSVCQTRTNGGDLGYFSQRSDLDQDFLEAAFNMEKGRISEVVKTQFGYHIIKITDNVPESTVAFEQANDAIVKWLTNQKKQAIIDDYIKSLSAEAQIVWARNQ